MNESRGYRGLYVDVAADSMLKSNQSDPYYFIHNQPLDL